MKMVRAEASSPGWEPASAEAVPALALFWGALLALYSDTQKPQFHTGEATCGLVLNTVLEQNEACAHHLRNNSENDVKKT